jgi:curli biogenesis system outer membrane secretion channel CsgG
MAAIAVSVVGLGSKPAAAAPALPTIAVYNFDASGLTPWWDANFNPGDALADLLQDRLVNAGTVSVVDREHLQQVLQEQNNSRTGDVTPASEAKLGRMLGVGYLFVGKIVQFDKSSNGGGGLGSRMFGGIGGGAASSTKTSLHVSVKVIEANSGRIVAAVDDEQSSTATSFAVAGAGSAAGGYKSPDFQSSAMGKLLGAVADDLTKKIDTSKLVASAPAPSINGLILASDDGNYVVNVGSDGGVQSGMTFSTFDVKHLVDPSTNKPIISEIPKGTVQVVSVSKTSSVAKKISGSVKVSQTVRSE